MFKKNRGGWDGGDGHCYESIRIGPVTKRWQCVLEIEEATQNSAEQCGFKEPVNALGKQNS